VCSTHRLQLDLDEHGLAGRRAQVGFEREPETTVVVAIRAQGVKDTRGRGPLDSGFKDPPAEPARALVEKLFGGGEHTHVFRTSPTSL